MSAHKLFRRNILGWALLLAATSGEASAQSRVEALNFSKLNHTHDVTVPAWGPYTKRYMGISHIADSAKGLRFDLSVMPGFYRQKVVVPNVLYESGYYPWNASADLNYFSFRQELEWKDQVYTDVAFAPFDKQARLVQITCANQTAQHQNLVLHLMESLNYPDINPPRAVLPANATWIRGVDYRQLQLARPRPQDNLSYDGFKKGEVRLADFVGGSGLAKGLGKDAGDQVAYEFQLPAASADAWLLLRYRVGKDTTSTWAASGIYNQPLAFAGTGEMATLRVRLGQVAAGPQRLQLRANGDAKLELDGFTVVDKAQLEGVTFVTDFHPVPQLVSNEEGQTVVLKYPDVAQYYGVAWNHEASVVRQFHNDQVDVALPLTVNNHGDKEFFGNTKGHYTDIFLRPIPLQPRQRKTLYALVCSGTQAEVERALAQFRQRTDYASYFTAFEPKLNSTLINPAGEKYRFGNQIIKTTTLQNVVFPVYTDHEYIKHFAPGRWWNSLYTWDSGFIGLGMTEIDTVKALEILNTYTTDADDPNAFVHHGSLVPTQFYLFQELVNRTRSRKLLTYFYPRLKKYYLFYTGQAGSSTMRMSKSGLLRTWDYFYNSGGWDDYPPQKFIRNKKEYTDHITSVISTSMGIRIAKIMRQAATMLGNPADVRLYDKDIATFSQGLQQYAWDPAAGYFGYVQHAADGTPSGIFKTDKGVNFNMGMDGAMPLVAGICTPEQQAALLGHLFSDKGCWTPMGMTAVDQSAPYYSTEGYWNGTVWFPHQWFFWKAMLDLGEGAKAAQIALTALETWEKEAELSYHSTEHFSVETGRGAGWHQFSGLSTPVLAWFGAYFRRGTLTTGFDTWVEASSFSADHTRLDATLQRTGPATTPTVLVCLAAGKKYRVTVNNREVPYQEVVAGALQIQLPAKTGTKARLKITPLD